MKVRTVLCATSAAILVMAAATGAFAQAAKSPKVVSKEELRVCVNTEAELAVQRKGIETQKAASVAEMAGLKIANAELGKDREELDETNDRRVREFKRKMAAYNERVKAANAASEEFGKNLDAFNAKLTGYNDSCGGISYSREDKEEILKEREAAAKK